MKKFIYTLSIFLLLLFTFNTITITAQLKTYSQGFYAMKDLNLRENVSYKVQNHEPYVEGLLIVVDADRKIQQLIRIPANSTEIPIAPLKYDYKFIIYNNILLTFS
ncbi:MULTISPECIES: hypothetical protein [Clostridium]|jgi:hypothetical protein|uniref:Uncharacterized protein n=3 Tax=Clostridium beijerinckii TaxID=1520 RepID=A0A1S8Q4C4_CLOBE|nr:MULTISPECIES: hypothetical protein [Clostridium]ABR35569.1 hypothetical protein Cbei_3444 [Clostridium beijerinckii NCIMB 8052]AIU05092.1 hypothetical protein Cbs_3444 [Clostridium beijerinckii ATCC 35702]ALB45389.1 hypothetical protein X276_08910 [Clostridium beijerinckii NRRL B-598]AQS06207.1 hypothetical protein CLBIJ_36540 [Clostridium beijerinckii]MBA2886245.1 hypothetical protein [Clostridium beijerinckii]